MIEWSYTTFKRGRGKGRTTLSQFWVLILYWPLVVAPLLLVLGSFDPFFVGLRGGRDEKGVCMCDGEEGKGWGESLGFSLFRMVFFPCVIWILEAVEGHTLIFLCGFNPGWCYDDPDGFWRFVVYNVMCIPIFRYFLFMDSSKGARVNFHIFIIGYSWGQYLKLWFTISLLSVGSCLFASVFKGSCFFFFFLPLSNSTS